MSLGLPSEAKPRMVNPSSLHPKFDNQYTEVHNFLYRVKSLNNVFIMTLHYKSNHGDVNHNVNLTPIM